MASYNTEERLCVKCGEPSSKGNVLSQVGAPKGRRKGICEDDLLEKIIEQSEKLKLKELTKILKNNKATHEPTHVSTLMLYSSYLQGISTLANISSQKSKSY